MTTATSVTDSPFHETRGFVRGPAGRLATLLTLPADGCATAGLVICSPSPLLGGDMENNVTEALARAAARRGLAALRFDYRNAGRSEDDTNGLPRFEWWSARREQADYGPVLDDARAVLAESRTWFRPVGMAGYSLGGWIALRLACEGEPKRVVAICPPLAAHDFSAAGDSDPATLLIVAGDDPLDPPGPASQVRSRFPAASLVYLDASDHFLIGEEALATEPSLEFLGRQGDAVAP